jgi:hypothetical protein
MYGIFPTECINMFRTILSVDMVPLNSIKLFIFAVETRCVFCEQGTEFLNSI